MKVTASYLENVAREWRSAFLSANGKEVPEVVWENGWFVVRGKRYRRAALEEMRDRLKQRTHAHE